MYFEYSVKYRQVRSYHYDLLKAIDKPFCTLSILHNQKQRNGLIKKGLSKIL